MFASIDRRKKCPQNGDAWEGASAGFVPLSRPPVFPHRGSNLLVGLLRQDQDPSPATPVDPGRRPKNPLQMVADGDIIPVIEALAVFCSLNPGEPELFGFVLYGSYAVWLPSDGKGGLTLRGLEHLFMAIEGVDATWPGFFLVNALFDPSCLMVIYCFVGFEDFYKVHHI